MKKYNLFFAILACVCVAFPSLVCAQGITTPYSKFGYGMLGDNATSGQRAMGGIGYAMRSGRQINAMNPASYSATDSLTFLFDMGLDLNNMWSKEQGEKAYALGGGLDYVTMQFPISKTVGGSIGLVPFSSVGFSYMNTLETGYEARNGKGGINQIYAGVSWSPFKNFSIGANVSYNFGSFSYSTFAYSTSTTLFQREMQVRDYGLLFGVQYAYDIDKEHTVAIGAVYSPNKSLHGNTLAYKYDSSQDAVPDTVATLNLNGNYTTPHSFGAGVSYTRANHYMVEADFTYQCWNKAKYATLSSEDGTLWEKPTVFNNRYRISLGGYWIPNYRGNYAQRITLRAGAWFNHDYLNVNGNNIKDFGVGIGFGLPTSSSKTVINIGFEYRSRFSKPTDLIKEDYINITLGINFNETWFWKNKIR